MNPYSLPQSALLGGREYPHRTDFREILRVIGVLNDPQKPELLRWHIAIFYFFTAELPPACYRQAMEYLAAFLSCGERGTAGRKLFDWEQDAGAIIADVNAVAGKEIREAPMHWWTFLSFFRGIREGQLSFLVNLREKLRRGEKLEPHEQQFYVNHKDAVILRENHPPDPEKQRLLALLGG